MTAARIPMHDFYAHSRPMPLDQADGLRRMFAGRQQRVLALVANPYVAFSGVVLDRLVAGIDVACCPHCRLGRWQTIEVLQPATHSRHGEAAHCRGPP